MHHFGRKPAKITELGVGIGHETFRVVDDGFNRSVCPAGCSMVNVNGLKLNVERTCVRSA